MDELSKVLIYIVIIGIIVIILAICDNLISKARTKAVKKYCKLNGLTYQESSSNIPFKDSFDITKKGNNPQYKNIIMGKKNETAFAICDFIYETGSGEEIEVHKETIIALMNPDIHMPYFYCRDKNIFFDVIGKMFGGQDIDFAKDKKFSKKFVLQGHSELKIRKMFNAELRKAFVSNHVYGTQYEGVSNTFIICYDKFLKNTERNQFLMRAIKIFQPMYNQNLHSLDNLPLT